MKDIEQQLREQRDHLDIEIPPNHLWEDIRTKWKKEHKPNYLQWWKVAAVVFLSISIGLLAYNFHLKSQVEALATLGDISEEYRQVESDYQLEINELVGAYELDFWASKEIAWIHEELEELEKINKQYRSDIGQEADQEKLINALVDYYEKKIRLLKKLELEIKRNEHEKDNTTTGRTI